MYIYIYVHIRKFVRVRIFHVFTYWRILIQAHAWYLGEGLVRRSKAWENHSPPHQNNTRGTYTHTYLHAYIHTLVRLHHHPRQEPLPRPQLILSHLREPTSMLFQMKGRSAAHTPVEMGVSVTPAYRCRYANIHTWSFYMLAGVGMSGDITRSQKTISINYTLARKEKMCRIWNRTLIHHAHTLPVAPRLRARRVKAPCSLHYGSEASACRVPATRIKLAHIIQWRRLFFSWFPTFLASRGRAGRMRATC